MSSIRFEDWIVPVCHTDEDTKGVFITATLPPTPWLTEEVQDSMLWSKCVHQGLPSWLLSPLPSTFWAALRWASTTEYREIGTETAWGQEALRTFLQQVHLELTFRKQVVIRGNVRL